MHAAEPHERGRDVGRAERVDAARDARAQGAADRSVTRSEQTIVPLPGVHTAETLASRASSPSGSSPTTMARAGTLCRTSSTIGHPAVERARRRRDDHEVHRARARLAASGRRPAASPRTRGAPSRRCARTRRGPRSALTAASSAVRRARADRRPARAPRAGRVERRRLPLRGPAVEDGIDERPLLLDLVAPREERRLAAHRVEQEPLVGLGRVRAERRAVAEVHRDVAQDGLLPGLLRDEAERDALVGLDAHREHVRA